MANHFGTVSLRKSAMARLKVYLNDLLQKGIDDFLWEVHDICRCHEDPDAIALIAKLTCKDLANLRTHEAFNDLTDTYSEFLRAAIDDAAREGILNQGSEERMGASVVR